MKAQDIRPLLDKYWDGETTEEEEKSLQAYFNSGEVETSLKQFQPYFGFFQQEKEIALEEKSTDKFVENIKNQPVIQKGRILSLMPHLWKFAAAAVILIGALIMIPRWTNPAPSSDIVLQEDSYDDPEKAYAEVKAALLLVSNKMKKGTSVADKNLGKLKKASIFRTEETEL